MVAAGAHTVHHSALTEIDREARRFEIAESKHFAEALTDDGVTAFAYPFGAFDVEARSDVTAAGFTCACSTRHGLVSVDSDLFACPASGFTFLIWMAIRLNGRFVMLPWQISRHDQRRAQRPLGPKDAALFKLVKALRISCRSVSLALKTRYRPA